jgi:hypothetical protein
MNPHRLRDGMQAIVDHLARGIDLVGPVRVSGHWKGHARERPWGFADGRRASKISIEALAARGLIRIEEKNGRRRAELQR